MRAGRGDGRDRSGNGSSLATADADGSICKRTGASRTEGHDDLVRVLPLWACPQGQAVAPTSVGNHWQEYHELKIQGPRSRLRGGPSWPRGPDAMLRSSVQAPRVPTVWLRPRAALGLGIPAGLEYTVGRTLRCRLEGDVAALVCPEEVAGAGALDLQDQPLEADRLVQGRMRKTPAELSRCRL